MRCFWRNYLGAVASLLLGSSVGVRIDAEPFRNGSFEEQAIGGFELHLIDGSTDLIGWTVEGDIALTRNNARFGGPDPADGAQHLVFNSGTIPEGSMLSQVFDTEPGQRYEVSFKVGRRGFIQGVSAAFLSVVDAGTGELLGCTQEHVLENPYIGPIHFNFTAISDSSRMVIQDISIETDGIDLLLDDVRVVQVEPIHLEVEPAIKMLFQSKAGKIYQLEGAESVSQAWKPVGEKIQGTGEVLSIYQSAVDPGLRLFRLVQESQNRGTECVVFATVAVPLNAEK